MIAQIGQDDDIRALGQRRQRFGGAGDQGLALHLGRKEFVQHRPDPLAAALEAVDPDRLTPREALEKLYELKRLAQSSEGMS